jgi:hypothetical protein
MYINQTDKDKAISWRFLPDTNTLLQYLSRIDLIELSKCCKRYRCQLEYQVLEKLDLYTWCENNKEIYEELKQNCKLEDALKFLKTDLDGKLKFAKKFSLDCEVNCSFAHIFVNLLPNIKSLSLYGSDEYECCLGDGSIAILKNMKHLEHVFLSGIEEKTTDYSTDKQIFPKSLKSFKLDLRFPLVNANTSLTVHDAIDSSYVNLYSLSIVSNRMLQNLACEMPNLKEVEIEIISGLNESNFIEFLNANPQIKRLDTNVVDYTGEIYKTILSLKFLERWHIKNWKSDKMDVNDLLFNYSIKYLKFSGRTPAPLALKIINSCTNLETLDLRRVHNAIRVNNFWYLEWHKLERNITILKLNSGRRAYEEIKIIDDLKLFNQVHFYYTGQNPIEKQFDEYFNYKLINYKANPYIPQSLIRKLTN